MAFNIKCLGRDSQQIWKIQFFYWLFLRFLFRMRREEKWITGEKNWWENLVKKQCRWLEDWQKENLMGSCTINTSTQPFAEERETLCSAGVLFILEENRRATKRNWKTSIKMAHKTFSLPTKWREDFTASRIS